VALTLTYAPEHIPELASVSAAHFNAFVKALKYRVKRRGGDPFRYHGISEYAPGTGRPHYHVALFGYLPPDSKPAGSSGSGNPEFSSEELTQAWGRGRVTFQFWSPGAAAYISKHNAFKSTGLEAQNRMRVTRDGEVIGTREQTFMRCSGKPGIGALFCDKFGEQMAKLGFTVRGTEKVTVPGYYLDRLADRFPEAIEKLRAEREAIALGKLEGITIERMRVLTECADLKLDRVHRKNPYQ